MGQIIQISECPMTDWMNLRFDSFSQSLVQNVWRRWCAEKSGSITGSRPSALALSGSSALCSLMTRLIASFTAEGEYTLPVPDTNTKCLKRFSVDIKTVLIALHDPLKPRIVHINKVNSLPCALVQIPSD